MAPEYSATIDCPGFYDPEGEIQMTAHSQLPHWHQSHAYVFITWRLNDALPPEVIAQLTRDRTQWMANHPPPWTLDDRQEYARKFSHRADKQLDCGYGSCILREGTASSIVAGALRHFDGERYMLDTFVVMPNHVHVLVGLTENPTLPQIVHSWKSFTSNKLRPFLLTAASIWQEGYWDRLIRNARHLATCRAYIRDNPAKAMLPEGQFQAYSRFRDGNDV